MVIFGIAFLLMQSALPPAPGLTIVIVDGEGGINNVRQHSSRDPVVQVQDDNGKPVSGATVVFTLPSQGAGGSFATGGKIATINTDAGGRAVARGFRPNNTAGKFEIRVNASHENRTARATITQFNMLVPGAGKHTGTKVAVVVLAAGAAAAVGVVAGRGNGKTAASPSTPGQPSTIVLSPGSGSVGPPR
jgi:hypothetical protein